MDIEESRRIHQDWWGNCRTCRFWSGDCVKIGAGVCTNERSPVNQGFRLRTTQSGGKCDDWDSFDVDVALEIMEVNDGT